MNRILVYVAHPYGGDIENKKKVEEFINPLKKYEEVTFISPLHAFWGYEETDYLRGIEDCLSLLEKCDVLAIPNFEEIKNSKGCLMELGFAMGNKMQIISHDELEGYLEAYHTSTTDEGEWDE